MAVAKEPANVTTDETGINSGTARADFYVTPDGDVIPSTGYRYSARNVTDLMDARSGNLPARESGMYFSFDSYDDAIIAQNKLQIP